jgi:hypothetical protein
LPISKAARTFHRAPRAARQRTFGLLLAATVLLVVAPASAATRYIATAGSDANPCTQGQPCLTMNRAYLVAAPGDTVEMAAGTYASQSIGKEASKTPPRVVFVPAPSASVVLSSLEIAGSHLEVHDVVVQQDVDVGSNPIDTRDVVLRNITARSMFLRADNVTVLGGSVGGFNSCDPGMPEDGIRLWSDSTRGGDSITLDGIYVHDIRRMGCSRHSDGIQIFSGTNHTIRNSRFVNMPTESILARPANPSQSLANILIENNFFGPVLDGIQSINIGTRPDECSGIVVRYNTVAEGVATFDCVTSDGQPGSTVYGNIIAVDSDNAATFHHNIFLPGSAVVGTEAVQCSPLYVDAATYDYHLHPDDTCARDRGDAANFPTTDIDSAARFSGAAPDAGADELTGISPKILSLAIRTADNSIHHSRFQRGTWGPFVTIPGGTVDIPALVASGGGILDLVVRGTDNEVYHSRYDGTAWSKWSELSGASADAPALVASGGGTLDLVVRGVDSGVHHNHYDGVTWGGWTALPGATADIPALAASGGGALDLVVRGVDNGVYHNHYDGATWSGWTALPGATADIPALVASGGGTLDLVVRGVDDGVYHNHYDGATWSGWTALLGATADIPALAARGGGVVDLAVRGTDDMVYHNQYSGVVWTGWTLVGGPTVDRPALVAE